MHQLKVLNSDLFVFKIKKKFRFAVFNIFLNTIVEFLTSKPIFKKEKKVMRKKALSGFLTFVSGTEFDFKPLFLIVSKAMVAVCV